MSPIAAQHPIFCVGRVVQIWLFAYNLKVVLGEKWNSADHKELMYSVRSSLTPYYTIKGGCGYETLDQQWMHGIAAQQPILRADSDRTRKIWYFTWNLGDLMTPSGPWWACICYWMLIQPSLYVWGRLRITQSAMDVSYYSTSSHLVCSEGAQNLIFCMKFESCFGEKWHHVNHKGLVYAVRSCPKFPYTYGKDNNTLT